MNEHQDTEHQDTEHQDTTTGSTSEQVEEMSARVARTEADIEALRKEAGEATHRAGVSDGRAEGDRHRIETLEARAVVDSEMLEELRAEGVITSDRAANLEVALQSARLIGAATGIIMARNGVSEASAFTTLKTASQNLNRKVRALAEDIVLTGDVGVLPAEQSEE